MWKTEDRKRNTFSAGAICFSRESKTRAQPKFTKYQNHAQCEPWCWVCAGKVAGWRGQCRHLLGAFPPCRHTSAPEQSYRGFHILKTWTERGVSLSVAPHQWSCFNTALANSCPHLFICEKRFWIKLAPGWTSGPLRTSFLIMSRLALFTCNKDKNTLTTDNLRWSTWAMEWDSPSLGMWGFWPHERERPLHRSSGLGRERWRFCPRSRLFFRRGFLWIDLHVHR